MVTWRAQGVVQAGEFQADGAGARHDQMVIQGSGVQQLVAVDDVGQVHALYRRAGGLAACGDEDVLCRQVGIFPLQGGKVYGVAV